MSAIPDDPPAQQRGQRRIRLSEWARSEGIARITAYRMLQRGILPVPAQRSPTGRWYVLVPEQSGGQTALYARTSPGADSARRINEQLFHLIEWAGEHQERVRITISEFADPCVSMLPKLEMLLRDPAITKIVIDNPGVIGESRYALLRAAMAPQGRSILSLTRIRSNTPRLGPDDARAALVNLCLAAYGPSRGREAAQRAIDFGGAARTRAGPASP